MVDVSTHILVPDHELLNEEEVDAVMAEYGIDRTDLPRIQTSDPALPNDASAGDVIRIERESRTVDTAVAYRLVVD